MPEKLLEEKIIEGTEGGQEKESINEPDDTLEVESQAKILGWKPKDEFNGPDEKWRDAAEYIQHGKDTLPILRENNKRLISEIQELKQTFKEFSDYHRSSIEKTKRQSYEKAIKDIAKEQRKAVEDGDVEKFDMLEQEKAKIAEPEPEPEPGHQAPEKSPELIKWEQANPWYEGDTIDEIMMTARANEIAAVMQAKKMPFEKILETVSEAMKREYPDHFTNKRASSTASVNSPTRSAGAVSGKKGKTFDDLDAEAKATCNRFVKEGLMTKEEYIKEYFMEE